MRLYFVFAIALLPSIRTDELIEINVWNVPQRFFQHRPVGKRINPPEQSLRVDFLANVVEKHQDICFGQKLSFITGHFAQEIILPSDLRHRSLNPSLSRGGLFRKVLKSDQPDE